MRVTCPGCTLCFAIPPELVGPAGARIVCPACRTRYVVDAAGVPADFASLDVSRTDVDPAVATRDERVAGAPPEPPNALRETNTTGYAVALERLRFLDRPSGALAGAAARGRLFSEFGPALLEAFETWRGIVGRSGSDAFLEALHDVAGTQVARGSVASRGSAAPHGPEAVRS